MNADNKKRQEIVWIVPDVKREKVQGRPVYHDEAGDELFVSQERLDCSAILYFERLREYIDVLQKANVIPDTHKEIMQMIINEGEDAVQNNSNFIMEHLGDLRLEISGDEIIGCSIELKEAASHSASLRG